MRIDPATVQLLFVDAQLALVKGSSTGRPDAIDRASGVLADCAALLGVPIAFSAVNEDGAEPTMLDTLRRHASEDRVFVRDSASPFLDDALKEHLRANGRRKLVIAGFASEVVVTHAAIDAIVEGYEVYLPLDAIGSIDPRTEAALMRQVERAGGEVGSVATFVTSLAPDFTRPQGKGVIAAVRTLSS